MNALTVDLEDWYHVCGVDLPQVPPSQWRVEENVERLLALLEEEGVRATFFVLGSVAASCPAIVPALAAAGHEVASHGWSHRLLPELGRDAFRDEVRRTGDLLAAQAGRRPRGFRAPQWSVRGCPWAFEVLAGEGYRYDSSANPLPFIGDPRGPRTPFRIATAAGELTEVPPLVTASALGNLPSGGGWGFRLFPFRMIETTVLRLNAGRQPAVIYVHPRELDPRGPRLALSPLKSFVSYGPRRSSGTRLRRLLRRFPFAPLADLVETWQSQSSFPLLTPQQACGTS